MKAINYAGTVGGYRRFGRRELLKAAFMGYTIRQDANRIQRALDKAASQDRVKQILTAFRGGVGA